MGNKIISTLLQSIFSYIVKFIILFHPDNYPSSLHKYFLTILCNNLFLQLIKIKKLTKKKLMNSYYIVILNICNIHLQIVNYIKWFHHW
jgi:hypothetical protein